MCNQTEYFSATGSVRDGGGRAGPRFASSRVSEQSGAFGIADLGSCSSILLNSERSAVLVVNRSFSSRKRWWLDWRGGARASKERQNGASRDIDGLSRWSSAANLSLRRDVYPLHIFSYYDHTRIIRITLRMILFSRLSKSRTRAIPSRATVAILEWFRALSSLVSSLYNALPTRRMN